MQRAITSSAVNNVAAARAGKSGGGGTVRSTLRELRGRVSLIETMPRLHLSKQRRERGRRLMLK